MKDERNLLIKSSMFYGLLMGLFWAFKYLFFIFSFSYPLMSYIYWTLTFFVPFFLAYLIIHYRIFSPEATFMRDWALGILIFTFAAIIVSLAHYLFYRYFAPPDYISDSLKSAVEMIKKSGVSEQMKETVEAMATPTPIQMTIQGLFNNIIYGVIISLPVAAITSRLKIKIVDKSNKE